MSEQYKNGATVVFFDPNGTTVNGSASISQGIINGEPLDEPEGSGVPAYIPVWAERDGGREPTTIYVSVHNLIQVGDRFVDPPIDFIDSRRLMCPACGNKIVVGHMDWEAIVCDEEEGGCRRMIDKKLWIDLGPVGGGKNEED